MAAGFAKGAGDYTAVLIGVGKDLGPSSWLALNLSHNPCPKMVLGVSRGVGVLFSPFHPRLHKILLIFFQQCSLQFNKTPNHNS